MKFKIGALVFVLFLVVGCKSENKEDILKKNGFKLTEEKEFNTVNLISDDGTILFHNNDGEIGVVFSASGNHSSINGLYHPQTNFYEFYPNQICNYDTKEKKALDGECSDDDMKNAETLVKLYKENIKKSGFTEKELVDIMKKKFKKDF